jgi:MerR family transcriptional regulator, copper efflux regulator
MDNSVSYSISEAADLLNLSAKTIRRYIKAGKLPSIKVPTKFGDEYRITEIPEALKQEASEQAEAQGKTEVVPAGDSSPALDAQQLYQENVRLAAQLGAATERIRQLEDQVKNSTVQIAPGTEKPLLLEGEVKLYQALEDNIKMLKEQLQQFKRPWWKKLFGMK